MATDAQDRAGQVDAERVANMRALLNEPGGEAEIARRYGEQAVNSDEFAAAKRQQQATTARQREAREAREAQAQRADQQASQRAQRQAQEARTPEQLRASLREGKSELNKAGKEATQARERSRESALSR